jgi:hydrogenase-4 component F
MNILFLYFGSTVVISILMYFLKNKIWDYLLFLAFISLQIFLNIHEYYSLGEVEGEYFKTDRIALLFLSVLTILSIPTIIHSAINAHHYEENQIRRSTYDSALVLFIAAMTGALISNNVGLTWAFLEATTLCASILIFHDRDAAALEAAWKYAFVCSIAIALAFVGILFLGIATEEAGNLDLSMESLIAHAPKMNPSWLKICFLFIITGYSVKLGVAPLFTVDIDAKDAAPSPIAGLFSGALLNAGFLGIFRFYEILSHTSIFQWMNNVLMIVGLISVFFATVYILRVKNFKRLLAYSSLEHAGIILLGLAAGGIGYIAIVLHLVFHAFTKASLFLQIGQVRKLYSGQNFDKMGGYFRYNPYGSAVIILGFICITALPPSAIFLGKFLTLAALFEANHYIIAFSVLTFMAFIFYGLAKNLFQLVFGEHKETTLITPIHPMESVSQIIMLVGVIYMGLYPPSAFIDYVKSTVEHLPNYSYGIF